MRSHSLPHLIVATVLGALIGSSQAEPLLNLHQQGVTIVLQANRLGLTARKKPGGQPYRVDEALTQQLRDAFLATQLLELGDGDERFFVVLTEEMSRPSAMGRGYCGAGEEHYLLLLSASGNVLRLRDKLLVSSCFESIALDVPEGHNGDTLAALQVNDVDDVVRFAWLNDGPRTERVLSIEKGRFSLELRPAPANDDK